MTKRTPLFFAQLGLTLAVCVYLIAPAMLSIASGLMVNYQQGIGSGLTSRWVEAVLQGYGDTLVRSIGIALCCVLTTLVLGIPAAYALARQQTRWTRLVEELMMMPVAIPGLATALALILAYGGNRELRTSSAFILIGHVLFTLPFMVRSVMAVMLAIDIRTFEEGAASLGAGFARRFLTIVLPNCSGGILAGAMMVFTLSIGEFNMTWLLHTPLTKTLPVGLADAYASLRFEIGSAYTLIFLIMIIPLLLAMQSVARWNAHR